MSQRVAVQPNKHLGFKAVEPLSQLDDRFLQQVLVGFYRLQLQVAIYWVAIPNAKSETVPASA
jgi:hypothetical protein